MINKTDHIAAVAELIEEYKMVKGALLPLLHAIQEKIGFIPSEAVAHIANGLNLSRAEVHGVVTYYHFFRTENPGKNVVQVCRAEACQACGSDEILKAAEEILRCKVHHTSADGASTLEPVYCLGLCASGPAIQVNEKLHGCVSVNRLKEVLAQLEDK
jgi:formate dehydrogenase subunit gamma